MSGEQRSTRDELLQVRKTVRIISALPGALLIGLVVGIAHYEGPQALAQLHLTKVTGLLVAAAIMLVGMDLIRCGLTGRRLDPNTRAITVVLAVYVLIATLLGR